MGLFRLSLVWRHVRPSLPPPKWLSFRRCCDPFQPLLRRFTLRAGRYIAVTPIDDLANVLRQTPKRIPQCPLNPTAFRSDRSCIRPFHAVPKSKCFKQTVPPDQSLLPEGLPCTNSSRVLQHYRAACVYAHCRRRLGMATAQQRRQIPGSSLACTVIAEKRRLVAAKRCRRNETSLAITCSISLRENMVFPVARA